MTRHKLLAANIKLQIGLSASVRPTGDSEVSDPMAREGEEAILAVFMALRCGLK